MNTLVILDCHPCAREKITLAASGNRCEATTTKSSAMVFEKRRGPFLLLICHLFILLHQQYMEVTGLPFFVLFISQNFYFQE